jgi:hypothetical protein
MLGAAAVLKPLRDVLKAPTVNLPVRAAEGKAYRSSSAADRMTQLHGFVARRLYVNLKPLT